MKKIISEGVTLNCIQSKKFKDICLSINFLSDNDIKKATKRSLLSMMLVDRCNKYDTKKKMSDKCDLLYGCSLGSRVLTYGKGHCIEIRSKIINPMYIDDNQYFLDEWIDFVSETIFNPLMNNHQFDDKLFDENKKILYSRIKRREDDAQSYTVSKVLELAGKNQPLCIKARGDLSVLSDIQLEEITKQYDEMIDYDQIEIVACGDFNEEEMIQLIESKLKFKNRKKSCETYYSIENNDFGIQSEEKKQSQTNIAMIYSTDILILDQEYSALKVANGILGQLPSSYLFQVVREQHSLCYSILSTLISYDGALLITTGIEKENIEKTISLIQQQIKRCQDGDFSEELLQTTKKMLINGLLSSLDEMSSIVGYNLGNSILNREYTIEENIQNVEKVTKEDCIRVFNKMKHMATYICASEGDMNE